METEDNLVLAQPYEQYRPYVPEGSYNAKCVDYKWTALTIQGNKGPIRKKKLLLKFELMDVSDESEKNVVLFASFNMPWDKQISPASRYFKAWVKTHGGFPSRNAVLSPRIFKNKAYRVKVRTVKPKDGGEELPECFHYSIVDSIHTLE